MPTRRWSNLGSKPAPLRRVLALVLCAGGGAGPSGSALAQQAGERVVVDAPADRDLYLAGGAVEIAADVAGDVLAVGGTVALTGTVAQDLAAGGGTVQVRGRVGDDVRAAGGEVTIAADVGDSVVLAGGSVRIARDAKVGGRALLAAGEIAVDGDVAGELRAAGGTVRIGGSIGGDAHIEARDRIVLGPDTRIGGDLVYSSPAPVVVPPGATIAGRVVHTPVRPSRGAAPVAAIFAVLWTLGLALAAVVLLVAFPRFTLGAAGLVASAPARAAAAGAVHLFVVPVAAGTALFTAVGTPIALAVLGLWVVALFAGWLVAAVFLADLAARRLGRAEPGMGARAALTALAAVVLALVGAIPVLGWLFAMAALLLGTGALLLALGRALRSGPPEATPAPPMAR